MKEVAQIQYVQKSIVMQLVEHYRYCQRIIQTILRWGTRCLQYYCELGLTGIKIISIEGWRSFWARSKEWLLRNSRRRFRMWWRLVIGQFRRIASPFIPYYEWLVPISIKGIIPHGLKGLVRRILGSGDDRTTVDKLKSKTPLNEVVQVLQREKEKIPRHLQYSEREAIEFLRTAWLTKQTHRPLLVIGNGPSMSLVDARRLPVNPVIFRTNLFMFERNYPFGKRVDAMFWAVHRRLVHAALEVSIRHNLYDIGMFFYVANIRYHALSYFLADALRYESLFYPRFNHWCLMRLVPDIDARLTDRKKYSLLPTVGLQALATGLILGFRDIYLAGIDFYEDSVKRYAFDLPDYVEMNMAPIHKKPGYEQKSHGQAYDIDFLQMLERNFPTAKIYSLVPESYSSSLIPVAPILNHHWCVPTMEKDMSIFHNDLKNALEPGGQQSIGEASYKHPALIRGWAWDPSCSAMRVQVELRDIDNNVTASTKADEYLDQLDVESIGDAYHGFQFNLSRCKSNLADNTVRIVFIGSTGEVDGPLLKLPGNVSGW